MGKEIHVRKMPKGTTLEKTTNNNNDLLKYYFHNGYQDNCPCSKLSGYAIQEENPNVLRTVTLDMCPLPAAFVDRNAGYEAVLHF